MLLELVFGSHTIIVDGLYSFVTLALPLPRLTDEFADLRPSDRIAIEAKETEMLDMTTDPTAELHPGFSSPGTTATPWSEVVGVLEQAEIFWIATMRADGRPHVTPLPAMWLDGALHFATGLEEQKGRNLSRNPNCVLTTGTNSYRHGLDVVVEGKAERVTDRTTLERLAEMWRTRLDWPYDVGDDGFRHRPDGRAPSVDEGSVPVFVVRASKVLSFGRGERFIQTRYKP